MVKYKITILMHHMMFNYDQCLSLIFGYF